jgi:hypothetical protein
MRHGVGVVIEVREVEQWEKERGGRSYFDVAVRGIKVIMSGFTMQIKDVLEEEEAGESLKWRGKI